MSIKSFSFFDEEGNLHINRKFYRENSRKLGVKTFFYLIIKAKNKPKDCHTKKAIRDILGISRTTEWRWIKELKQEGYL